MANELPVSLYDSNSASVGTASNPLVIDPSGSSSQPITGTVTANQGGAWTVTIGAAIPAGSNTIGKVDQGAAGSSAWPVKTEVQIDYDTGAGTQNLSVVGVALPASGGAVAGGTATNPIRIDPTGGTTQPVSGTVTSNQGTAAAGSGAWPVTITDTSNTVVKPGDASNNAIRVNVVTGVTTPVTQVDRSTFTDGTSTFAPVGGYFNDSATAPTSGQAATARITSKRAIHINFRDNSGNEIGTASAPVRVDPTGTTTQPVAGVKTNNNAAPGATNVGTLPAIANATAPSWAEGNQVALSVDLFGSKRSLIASTVGTVSTANSSTATLTANSVFTGTSENITGYASIGVEVFADQNSAALGLSFQFSEDGTNWDFTETYTITASTPQSFALKPCCKFFRIVYTNGATGQGAFRLQTIFRQIAVQLGGSTKEPVRVDPVGTTIQPVSGTVTANQGGTWNVGLSTGSNTIGKVDQGTGGASAWKVDGSAVTQPVSAASLPLPAGAATSAKQPALGTAGVASADVITVQGVASMTALKVDGSAVTQPVSGTVTANAGTGTFTVAGGKTNNNAAPGATNVGSLCAIANAAAPSWVEGNLVALSVDLAGGQRVTGTVTAISSKGSVTDRSGTITLGGTAQTLMAANATRKYLLIENVSNKNLWFNFTTTAVQDQPSCLLLPNAAFVMEGAFVSTEAISVIGATTGKSFTAKEN